MNNEYTIRQETVNDYTTIYQLIKTAFETAEVKDGDEQDFAESLRKSANYIPELALVAERDGVLIGHIMLTAFKVLTEEGGVFPALMLAPISVLSEYRDKGVGSSLIHRSFELAKSLGHKSVFLCGNPEYYKRFGFVATNSYGIYNMNEIPDRYVMVCELEPHVLNGVRGKINFYE